jgi:hypothetical protein
VPNRMDFEFLPTKSLQGIFLEQFLHQIIEFRTDIWELRYWVHLDHLNQGFQTGGVKWGFSSRHLVDQAPEGPEVGRERINSRILEQFRRHVVWSTLLILLRRGRSVARGVRGIVIARGRQIRYLFTQAEVPELKVAELVNQEV